MAQEGRDEKGKFTEKNLYAHVYSERQGRPLAYETPDEIIEKGFEFFEWCQWARKGKITSAGLRLYLGISRKTYHNYSKRADFLHALTYLEDTLEDFNELKLGWAGSTQGAIFWLKNKAGWQDEIVNKVESIVTNVETKTITGTPPLEDKE